MNKQQTHLTPEQVQELQAMGVEFGETTLEWSRYAKSTLHVFGKEFKNEWRLDLRFSPDDVREFLPAPNLQEVLEVLPLVIKGRCLTGDQEVVSFFLSVQKRPSISNDSDFGYSMKYVYSPDDPYDMCTMMPFCDTNPLIAAFDLLRWVCKYYPESLTKTKQQ